MVAPGPSVVYILSTTLAQGRARGLAATAGIEVSYLLHVAGTVLGVSAVIAASAEAFTAVKIAGGLYLLFLAVRAWRSRSTLTVAEASTSDARRGLGRTFLRALPVGALNPKTAVFYLAFLPQFVVPEAGPVAVQLLVFGLEFIVIAAVFDSMWAIGGGWLRRVVPRLRLRVLDRASAVVMAALAAVTLTARRSS